MQGDIFSFSIYKKHILIAEGTTQIATTGRIYYSSHRCLIDGHYKVGNKHIVMKLSIKTDRVNDDIELSSSWDESSTIHQIIDQNSGLIITITKLNSVNIQK